MHLRPQRDDWYLVNSASIQEVYERCVRKGQLLPGVEVNTANWRRWCEPPPKVEEVLSLRLHLTHLQVLGFKIPDTYKPTNRYKDFVKQGGILRPYQEESIRLASTVAGCLIADDLGLGKTLTALLSTSEGSRTMIVCPLSAIPVWQSQIKQWLGDKLKILVLSSKDVEYREENTKADFYILPYSCLSKHGGYFHSTGVMGKLETLIADEAHTMCLKSTHWAKIFRTIGRNRTILLTGTPMRNKLTSLWGLLDCMAPHAWGSLPEFRLCYCGAKHGAYGLEDGMPTHVDELAQRLKHVFIKHTREQAKIDIPSHERRIISVALSQTDRQAVHKQVVSLAHGVRGASGDCLRVLNVLRHEVGLAKLRYLSLDFLRNVQDEFGSVVYWVWHKDIAKELEYRLKQLDGIKVDIMTGDSPTRARKLILDYWSQGIFPPPTKSKCALVLSIGAGSTAISLNRARAAVFVELDWGTYQVMQAEKRHHRFGSAHKEVTTIYLVAEQTADEQMCRHILEKAQQSESVLGEDGQVDLATELLQSTDSPLKKPFHELLRRLDDVPDKSDLDLIEEEEDWPIWVNEKEWV